MDYSIIYHPEVKNDILGIPKNIKDRIKKAIENKLLADPIKYGEPLRRSLQGYRKLRVGNYRIIYKIEKNNIEVLKIGHRREVYDKPRYE
ncbi:MAG: type II toxin-antitoxin system RelE/ParE family toxin [Candidatus Omnitrophica bacterium]|nr:type II toxin-antitoxin system RelE/ParE family toxin [Candidatus Omnitrophota bacterium]